LVQYLPSWLAELRPKHKPMAWTMLLCYIYGPRYVASHYLKRTFFFCNKELHITAGPKEKTPCNTNPVPHCDVMKHSSAILHLATITTRKDANDDEITQRQQPWQIALWNLHAIGVLKPGAQYDMPAVERPVTCERRWSSQ
jgi:hypothetical protein